MAESDQERKILLPETQAGRDDEPVSTKTAKLCPFITRPAMVPQINPLNPRQVGMSPVVNQVNCDRSCALFNDATDGCSFHANAFSATFAHIINDVVAGLMLGIKKSTSKTEGGS